ncbi:Ig-like domain-containing protein [Pedobacter glucosidilyticus]|uniref:Ig-like domain-containing protein n=1 Tax=Pedobacter glucosidilyticus TaxID=1122941 RepID=UPI0004266427|nr:Ig-like domain-containing protein [Pedobacter glucosidilyticus]
MIKNLSKIAMSLALALTLFSCKKDEDNNQAPIVSITSPTTTYTYVGSQPYVEITAEAYDNDGTIAKVEFYRGTTLVATETIPDSRKLSFSKDRITISATEIAIDYSRRFSAFIEGAPFVAGPNTITAKAYDDKGKITTSAAVTFTLQLQNVVIALPASIK